MPYGKGRIKMGKEITGRTRDSGGYSRTPAPAGKVRNDMDPKKGYKKPKPGKPGWATIMPVKPGKPGKTKPGRKTIQPVKPGLKRGM